MAMKFWGVEVKPATPVTCNPGDGKYIHLSQASLGESKVKEKVTVYLKVDDKKLVIGSLSFDTCAQISYDLVFEKEFELSHSSKNASVSFCGYKSFPPGEEFDEDDSESEEDEPITLKNEGKSAGNQDQVEPNNVKAKAAKGESSADKQAKPAKVDKSDAKDEDSDDDEDDSSDDDEDMVAALSDSDEEDESSDEEEDNATPKKPATLKRPPESTSKTPAPEKKAKIITPAGAKTGGEGKKNVRVATPHPAKQAAKTPANSDKSKQQTPKSAGSVPCKSCSRTFNSESALQAHTKAKHA